MRIETERLTLMVCDIETARAILAEGDALQRHLGCEVADEWAGFGLEPYAWVIEQLEANPGTDLWWGYLPILKEGNVLIGSGGFKGPPDKKGSVEIGYEIAPAYRSRGLATEMARALCRFAASQEQVKRVIAHTLPEENHSVKLLRRLGFVFVQEDVDPDEGLVWKWKITKNRVK
jgi:RimJ/RimL family protein N-acetyltransferase